MLDGADRHALLAVRASMRGLSLVRVVLACGSLYIEKCQVLPSSGFFDGIDCGFNGIPLCGKGDKSPLPFVVW